MLFDIEFSKTVLPTSHITQFVARSVVQDLAVANDLVHLKRIFQAEVIDEHLVVGLELAVQAFYHTETVFPNALQHEVAVGKPGSLHHGALPDFIGEEGFISFTDLHPWRSR